LKCKMCGKEFQGKTRGRPPLYCSKHCRNGYRAAKYRRMHIRSCKWCNSEFHASPRQRFCSPACAGRSRAQKKKEESRAEIEGGYKKCRRCNIQKPLSEFYRNQTNSAGYDSYCKSCKREMWAKKYGGGRIKRNNERRNILEKRRTAADPRYKLNKNIGRAICDSLRDNHGISNKRGRKWESLVGFTLDELRAHLEKQFADGMSWDNYGEWHIDHIIPIAAHNFRLPEHRDFKRCWSLSNLQPLWAKENHRKHAKINEPFQPSLII